MNVVKRVRCALALSLFVVVACGREDPPRDSAPATTSVVGSDASTPAAEETPSPTVSWHLVTSADGGFTARWRAIPEEIPSLDPFSLEVELYRDEACADLLISGELSVDAAMPHHGHGMNVRPRVTRIGPGRYRVDAMLFHMGGRWELYFDHLDEGIAERAQTTVVLP